jgi:hypothetical protein
MPASGIDPKMGRALFLGLAFNGVFEWASRVVVTGLLSAVGVTPIYSCTLRNSSFYSAVA